MKKNAKVAVGVLLSDSNQKEEKILVIQKAKNLTWELPGGKIEEGETLRQAAVRETKEETNLIVNLHNIVGCFSNELDGMTEVFIVFKATLPNKKQEIILETGHCNWRWVKIDNLKLLDTVAPRLLNLIPQYMSGKVEDIDVRD